MAATLLFLGGCGQPARSPDVAGEVAVHDIAKATAAGEVERLRGEVADLKRKLARKERETKPAHARKIADRGARRGGATMCYKDYCPCDPPQEGMDSIICDQLQSGIAVAPETMIAGRGSREYRRQAAAIGF